MERQAAVDFYCQLVVVIGIVSVYLCRERSLSSSLACLPARLSGACFVFGGGAGWRCRGPWAVVIERLSVGAAPWPAS